MTKHFENACCGATIDTSALTAFCYDDEQYLCASDWPHILDIQKPLQEANQGWPWLDQLEWFEQLKQFESIHGHHHNYQYALLRVYQKQQLILWLPLRISLDRHFIEALSNYYTPEVVLVVVKTSALQSSKVWALIFQAITTLWPHWRQLSLQPLSTNTLNTLQQIGSKEFGMLFAPAGHNWRAKAQSKEDYWNKRQSQLINTINRKKKKLQQQHADIQISKRLTPELLKDYWHIYQHSWKQPEPGTEFIDWLLAFGSQNGQLRLGIMYIDHQPVAFQFWLVQKQQAAIVKLAQDQAFDALSPGTVLMAAMIDHVMTSDFVTDIDFLTGNDAYKVQWMDQYDVLYRSDIINCQHINGKLHFASLNMRRHLRHLKSKLEQCLTLIKIALGTHSEKAGVSRD